MLQLSRCTKVSKHHLQFAVENPVLFLLQNSSKNINRFSNNLKSIFMQIFFFVNFSHPSKCALDITPIILILENRSKLEIIINLGLLRG